MKNLAFVFPVILLLSCTRCGSGEKNQQPKERSVSSYFKIMDAKDTLHFEVTEDDAGIVGDTVPNGLFFGQMETRLMNDVPYFDNSGELTVIGQGRFPLTKNIEAYLVDMSQSWIRHKSLFLFDQQKKAFIDRVTVADFFGGDGGQILTGSYLLDFDGDGDKDLVRREIEHWLVMDGEEVMENFAERGVLLLWQGEGFEETYADSAALVKWFPIKSFW